MEEKNHDVKPMCWRSLENARWAGVGTVMLNYQRHMNMERVQMDYLILRRAGRDI